MEFQSNHKNFQQKHGIRKKKRMFAAFENIEYLQNVSRFVQTSMS